MPTLAERVRAKYPGAYDDLSDSDLESKVLSKYPEYKDLAVSGPSLLSRAKDSAISAGRGALQTGKDLTIGAAKGAATAISGASGLAPLVDRIASMTSGRPRMDTSAPDQFLKEKTETTNRTQLVGKVGALATQAIGPSVAARAPGLTAQISKLLGKKAPGVVAPAAKAATAAGPAAPAVPIAAAQETFKAAATRLPQPRVKVQPPREEIFAQAPARNAFDDVVARLDSPDTFTPTATKLPSGKPRVKVQPLRQEVDTILNTTGDVKKAAETIEQRVKLSVDELVRAGRTRYGSQRAGDMLFGNSKGGDVLSRGARKEAIQRLAPGPSKTPQIVEEARANAAFKRMTSGEGGFINPKVAGSMGLGAAGAAVGATQGEDTDDRVMNAFMGGAAGALLVPMIAHTVAVGAPKAMKTYLYGSILSSPSSAIKALSGAIGGSVNAAAELIAVGEVKRGSAILRTLFSPSSAKTWMQALKNPETAQLNGMTEGLDAPSTIGKIFGAGDAVGRRAMAAGGIGPDEAANYMLGGKPTTKTGQKLLEAWSDSFVLRLVSMFPRVGIQAIERGVERSPLGLFPIKGINEGASTATKVVRAAGGTGATLAGAEANDHLPDWAKPYAAALSGVYGLPVSIGMAVSEANSRGGSISESLGAISDTVARNTPFPQYGPAEAGEHFASLGPLVPNIVRDVARAKDPFERSTEGQGHFARAKAKIPNLRETLPVKGRAVNIAGEPNEDRSTPLRRFMSAANPKQNEFKGIPEHISKELTRLEIDLNVPSFEKHLQLGGRKIPIPPEAAERARKESRQFLLPALERLLKSPGYRSANDESKKQRMNTIINQARTAGTQKSRAGVMKLLREQGALRVGNPNSRN